MKIVIIEDEIIAAQTLGRLVCELKSDMEIIAVLQTIEESVEWFKANALPDLVFMDIHLADGSSFEIFKSVEINCPIIFTTAYNEYALEAFDVNSIDYLLKPINKNRLERALDKFGSFSFRKDNSQLIAELVSVINERQKKHKSHFLIPHKDKFIPLNVSEIAYFVSEFKIARVVTFDAQDYNLDFSLEELMKHLDPDIFFRVNRQYIVSHKAIKDMSVWFTGKLSVNLHVPVNERILVSKARVSEFKDWYTKEI